MYQNDDKPEGTFAGLANMYEGIADAVRIRNGFPPRAPRPDKNGRWQDKAYAGQAFFWLYIDTAHPDFIYKLNAGMKGRDDKALAARGDPDDHRQVRRPVVDRIPGRRLLPGRHPHLLQVGAVPQNSGS